MSCPISAKRCFVGIVAHHQSYGGESCCKSADAMAGVMSDSQSLVERLQSSDAFQSLAVEAEVRSRFSSAGWEARQGAVYKDCKEHKLREADVVARRIWRSKRNEDILMHVHAVVECKTMRGFHLVMWPEADQFLQYQTCELAAWQGYYATEAREQITEILLRHGFEKAEVAPLLKRLTAMCYPRQTARIYRMLVRPFPLASFTAWRETNLGKDKDLDSSVFWRAVQALDSCVQSLQQDWLDTFLSDLSGAATLVELYNWDKQFAIESNLKRRSGMGAIYHPIVVTDAQLWLADEGRLREVPYARYVRSGTRFGASKWFDVVSRSSIESYVAGLTQHFDASFKQVRAKAWP